MLETGRRQVNRSLVKQLRALVGKENVLDADEDLLLYGYDATPAGPVTAPEAVVLPGDAEQVAAVVCLANEAGLPLVARGAGTGLTGGARPLRGGLVLSTQRLNRVITIDEENLQAVVQPGVVTEQLQQQVEARGLFYPPDPQSRATCTIGGNLAENAGGPRALKYGVTRTHVLAAEVVLPQGQLVRLGARTVKSVAGYDLLSLLVGSEGTLGVFTEATLRLLPLPPARHTLLAVFAELEPAARAVVEVMRAGILPSAVEFMDGAALRCVEQYEPCGLPDSAQALLIVEVDGGPAQVAEDAAAVDRVLRRAGAVEVRLARDDAQAADLWRARRSAGPALARIAPLKVNEDIVVPLSQLPRAVTGIQDLAAEYDSRCAIFGHAGDGNLHVNFMADPSRPEEVTRVEEAVARMFELVVSLGGSITGEHGVGTTKQAFLGLEVPAAVMDVMRRIKRELDPAGIMNPGKIFPLTENDARAKDE
ncbi:MAG: glycolate oxidase subunit GlcD [Deltaproteobacteria bacterium]|nr:MAG: glycolate oxidase subunit GlcD [Deltaproteobacteria bacterium]